MKIFIYFTIYFLSFAQFLPVFYAPDVLHNFFSQWSIFLHFPAILLLLGYTTYEWIKKRTWKVSSIWVSIYVILFLAIPVFRQLDNHFIMWVNQGRTITEFSNPILGRRMDLSESQNTVRFVYDDVFLTRKELVYWPNHGLNRNQPEIAAEASYGRIYNDDWYEFYLFD